MSSFFAKTVDLSRRAFVKSLVPLVAWGAALLAAPRITFAKLLERPKKEETPVPQQTYTPKWGMAIDLDKCIACGACVVACASENNVPPVGPLQREAGTEIYWMNFLVERSQQEVKKPERELPIAEKNAIVQMMEWSGGDVEKAIIPTPCMHCDDPPCVKVCPVGATSTGDDGLVMQIYGRCIGCRYCMEACPYARRYFNWTEPAWPDSLKSLLNPDVATRPQGVVEKCTFCVQRIRRVREDSLLKGEPLKDQNLQKLTACAEACPADAIVFGDLNNRDSLVSRLSGSTRAYRLLEHLGTKPKVTYLAKESRDSMS